jgi:hypothetical protein
LHATQRTITIATPLPTLVEQERTTPAAALVDAEKQGGGCAGFCCVVHGVGDHTTYTVGVFAQAAMAFWPAAGGKYLFLSFVLAAKLPKRTKKFNSLAAAGGKSVSAPNGAPLGADTPFNIESWNKSDGAAFSRGR